jgi:hypothetical protein
MKYVRDARRQGIPLAVVQHEDVLVFTRPDRQIVSDHTHLQRSRTCNRGPHRPAPRSYAERVRERLHHPVAAPTT